MELYKLLKETYLFHAFSEATLEEVLKTAEKVTLPENTVILKEGEVSDLFYIIISGDVLVYCHHINQEKIYLARLSSGQYFGEQALLTETLKPRNASVITTSDCTLLALGRDQLHQILLYNTSLKKHLDDRGRKQELEKIMAQYNLLQSLPADILLKLGGEFCEYPEGTVLFREGDEADFAYFVLKGQVVLTFADENQLSRTSLIETGNFIGELAILKNQPRKATATAKTDIRVLRFDKEQFLNSYQHEESLQKLLSKMAYAYTIPARGTVTQHVSTYQGLDAMSFVFSLENGQQAIAWHVLQEPYFILTKIGIEPEKFIEYQNENSIVQLGVSDHKICSIVCTGNWEHLPTACLILFEDKLINEKDLKTFEELGELNIDDNFGVDIDDKIICYCMKVKEKTLIKHIQSGVQSVDSLCKLTGAGSICRTCKPNIHALFGTPAWMTAYIDEAIEENSSIISYIIRPLRGKFLPFKAGQHVILQIPYYGHNVQRAYTLTSSPNDVSCYKITVKSEENGLVSNWLKIQSERKIILQISPPQGSFLLKQNQTSPIIFFAGGVGVTPALAFLKYLTESDVMPVFYLDYSVQSEHDFVQKEYLEQLSQNYPNIEVNFRIAKRYGIITPDEIYTILDKHPNGDVYFCGPNGFREMVVKALHENNFDMANRFNLEIFSGVNDE